MKVKLLCSVEIQGVLNAQAARAKLAVLAEGLRGAATVTEDRKLLEAIRGLVDEWDNRCDGDPSTPISYSTFGPVEQEARKYDHIAVGSKVRCNGYTGTVTAICEGQLSGMAEVRLPGGPVCVSISELQRLGQ